MTSNSRPASSFPIAAAALTTIGLCCLSLLQFPDGDVPDLLLFFGRFHPVVLHAPIGLLVALALVDLTAFFLRMGDLRPVRSVLLWMTAITSVTAAVLGTLLALGGGYDETMLFRHRWLGVGLSIVVAWALALRHRRFPYGFLLLGALVLMGGAGHYGGSLTHGADYLVRYMPNGLRSLVGLPLREPPLVASVYAEQVQPIFDQYCTKCHGAAKHKGDLRLDSYEALMATDVVTPGDADGSHMVKLLRLPLDDLDHMPPDDKPQPSPEQIEAISAWISAGALVANKKI